MYPFPSISQSPLLSPPPARINALFQLSLPQAFDERAIIGVRVGC
jgi:hypothetical protein